MVHPSIYELFKSLSEELDPAKLQEKFLLSLLKLHNVSRGSIWIKKDGGYLCIEAAGAQSEGVKGISISAEHPSFVGWVIDNAKMIIADPEKDKRHYKGLEKNLSVKSRLILCLPLFLRDKTVYGAVQIIDTSTPEPNLDLNAKYLEDIQILVNIGSIALSNALLYSRQLEETESLRHALKEIRRDGVIIGQSSVFQKAIELVKSYASTDFPVLIIGESGTGKELFANRIHQLSNRRDKPFLVQNCGAIPESLLESELFGYRKGAFSGALKDKIGLFEAADGGTVFLDEIGDMPINLQGNILRTIQNGEIKPVGETKTKHVDIRIISATNKDIKTMLINNEFRQDLYFRLSVLPLKLPPMRERREDIPLLVNHFLKKEALRLDAPLKRISDETMQVLMAHEWPGNIRELENLICYLLVVTPEDTIDPHHLLTILNSDVLKPDTTNQIAEDKAGLRESKSYSHNNNLLFGDRSWFQVEKDYATYLLKKNQWRVTMAARDAQINRSTFVSRLRRLGIKRPRQ